MSASLRRSKEKIVDSLHRLCGASGAGPAAMAMVLLGASPALAQSEGASSLGAGAAAVDGAAVCGAVAMHRHSAPGRRPLVGEEPQQGIDRRAALGAAGGLFDRGLGPRRPARAFGQVAGVHFVHASCWRALFVISGGIYVQGSLSGTPLVNTAVLALRALPWPASSARPAPRCS